MTLYGTLKRWWDRRLAKGSLISKKRRQDEILGCLQSRTYWTAAQLCEHVSISQRTLMRDLAELKESGVPIKSERGRGGGIGLDGRWGVSRLSMPSKEVISLLLALIIAETLQSPILLENISSIRNRISSAFPYQQRRRIEQLRSRILVGKHASPDVMNSYTTPLNSDMSDITLSFMELRKLKIRYVSEKQELTERLIEPQILLLNWPIWYLLSWDELRNDVRLFRIDRIIQANITNTYFKLRKKQNLVKDFGSYFIEL